MIIDIPRSRICDGCKTGAAVVDASLASASKKTRASSVENAILNELSAAQLAKTVRLNRSAIEIRDIYIPHPAHKHVAASALFDVVVLRSITLRKRPRRARAALSVDGPRHRVGFAGASGWRVPHTRQGRSARTLLRVRRLSPIATVWARTKERCAAGRGSSPPPLVFA